MFHPGGRDRGEVSETRRFTGPEAISSPEAIESIGKATDRLHDFVEVRGHDSLKHVIGLINKLDEAIDLGSELPGKSVNKLPFDVAISHSATFLSFVEREIELEQRSNWRKRRVDEKTTAFYDAIKENFVKFSRAVEQVFKFSVCQDPIHIKQAKDDLTRACDKIAEAGTIDTEVDAEYDIGLSTATMSRSAYDFRED